MNPLVSSTVKTVVKKFGSFFSADADGADAGPKTPRDSNKEVAKTGQTEITVPTDPAKLIRDLVECLEKIKVRGIYTMFDKNRHIREGFVCFAAIAWRFVELPL